MLTLNYLTENKELAIEKLAKKGIDATLILDEIFQLDSNRKELQKDLNEKQAEMNAISKQIGLLFKDKKVEEANNLKARTAELKDIIKERDEQLEVATKSLHDKIVLLPNIPHDSVPVGKMASDNEVVKTGGPDAKAEEDKLPHWELASKYDIIDFELGVKLTGAGFPVYKGKGAKLQRALINFFLDEAEQAGYHECQPPIMVNEDSGFGTGQLPDKEGQMYHVGEDNLYLIPTAEVPVTNIYRDVIIDKNDFSIKLTAYTPCFRREAGSYGKDVRGLNRLHQFDKVEIVRIENPKNSYAALEDMVKHVEGLIIKLGLPYRILRLCGGDMSFTSALTYDFEVYSPAQSRWLEVSSVSNFESFQANRLKLRYKGEGMKKPELAHTLNGSALALPRIVASLLEFYQTDEGVKIPECLQKYTGFSLLK